MCLKITYFEDMSCHMTMYFFFQWLHIKTGCVIERINAESAKMKNTLIKEFKTQLCPELS